jgi:flagellar motor switch protein FliM
MSDLLDQNDIDALLASAAADTGGDVGGDGAAPSIFSRRARDPDTTEIKVYDFKRPERVSKDQMRALQTLHETFARNFGVALSGYLRSIVEIKVATCEQMTYSEFTSGLPNPTSFNLISADGLEGQMCMEISPLIIYPIIDRLLGGGNHDLFIPQRPLTLIETRLINNVTERGLAALSEAWAKIREMKFRIMGSESNPQLVQIVPPNEVVVVIAFELKLGNRAGTMNLCIPYNVIEPFMEHLSSQNWFSAARQARSPETEKAIGKNLSRAPMRVTGLLAQTTITVKELLTLAVGDIVVTEKPASSPVVLCVEEEKKYLAQIGQFRGHRALKIQRAIVEGDRV